MVLTLGGGMNLLAVELAKMLPVLSDRLAAPTAAALEDFSSGSKGRNNEYHVSFTF